MSSLTLPWPGIDLSAPWLVTFQSGQQQHHQQQQLVRQNYVQAFMRGLEQPGTRSSTTNLDQLDLIRKATEFKSALQSFLLPQAEAQTTPDSGTLISEDEMLNTHFNKILVSSLVNGAAGLQDVPIGSVLKHLMRYRRSSSILLEFLKHSNTHVARALAENLFRAAIEARDATALKMIVQIPCVDVNKTLCNSGGPESRDVEPIRRAADLGSLDLVKILRKAGAVIDNSKYRVMDEFPYYSLLSWYEREENCEDRSAAVHIAKELNLAGLETTIDDVWEAACHNYNVYRDLKSPQEKVAWISFRSDFLSAMISQLAQHPHSEFLLKGSADCNSLIYLIAQQVQDVNASAIIGEVLRICTEEHDGICLKTYQGRLGWALETAARCGKLQLVKLLLPHVQHFHRAFSAAIRSRNDDVIDAVLAYGPDINAPAHPLENAIWTQEWGFVRDRKCLFVTSFSEAILAENDRIIQMIQHSGHLEELEHRMRFPPALTAAAKTNDLGLLRTLLDRHDHPHPAELGPAVTGALMRGNEEAARVLLDAGGSTSEWDHWGDYGEVLRDALAGRNREIVLALLDASHATFKIYNLESPGTRRLGNYSYRGVLRAAITWGDESILTALFTTFPDMILEYDELVETLKNDNLASFNFLLASKRVLPSAIDQCLVYAINKGDETMIQHLISLGADCTDSKVLEAAVDAPLPIFSLIFKSRPMLKRPVPPGNGSAALEKAIEMGEEGLELVECLLQSDIVGLCLVPPCLTDSFPKPPTLVPRVASMGLAINQCCQTNSDDLRVVKLFLDAGYSPDSIVKSEDKYDESFPDELCDGSSNTSSSYHFYLSNTTALLLAIEWSNANLINLLLDHGANVNLPATCRILRTPLQKACEVGSLEIVKLLLDRGAYPNSKPARCQGATALQLAALSGNCNIAAELLDRGADLHQPPLKAGGRWPLEGAAEYGRLEMIEFLWRASIKGFEDRICKFAIKVAERRGHLACRDFIKDLMENGLPNSDLESRDPVVDIS